MNLLKELEFKFDMIFYTFLVTSVILTFIIVSVDDRESGDSSADMNTLNYIPTENTKVDSEK